MALINKKSIKTMTPSEILVNISGVINKVKKDYVYIVLHADTDNIILCEIAKSIKEYDGSEAYNIYIEKRIKNALLLFVKDNINDLDLIKLIVSDYIIYSFGNNDEYATLVKKIGSLFKFFKTLGYSYDPQLLSALLQENKVLYNAVEVIYLYNKDRILHGDADKIFNLYGTTCLIELYCDMNNITIQYNDSQINHDALTGAEKIYLSEVGKISMLTPEQEKNLLERLANGDTSVRKILIESNLRLVVSIARHYVGRGIPLMDLVQEGNIGLMKGIDRFDITMGNKLSTYVTWWIKQAITRYITDTGSTIRKPAYMVDELNKYRVSVDNLTKRLGRTPSDNEVANEMGISLTKVREYYTALLDVISLDQKVGEDDDTELGEFIAVSPDNIEHTVEQKLLAEEIFTLFKKCKLDKREIKILTDRFGLDGSNPKTLDEVGKELGLTRERVRQLEEKAKSKMRKPGVLKLIADYMDAPDKALESLDCLSVGKNTKSKLRKDDESMGKQSKSIYEYFSVNTKEQIDLVLKDLPDDDLVLIRKKYGINYDGVGKQGLSVPENNIYFGTIVPKIKRRLNLVGKIAVNAPIDNTPMKVYHVPVEENKAELPVEEARTNKSLEADGVKKTSVKDSDSKVEKKTNNTQSNLSPVSKQQSFDLTRMQNLFQILPVQDATIVSLVMGYVNGKRYSVAEVARFLNISKEDAQNIVAESLTAWKDMITSLLDKEIERVLK